MKFRIKLRIFLYYRGIGGREEGIYKGGGRRNCKSAYLEIGTANGGISKANLLSISDRRISIVKEYIINGGAPYKIYYL